MTKYLDGTGLGRLLDDLAGRFIPGGGTYNQIIAKSSSTDYDVAWTTLTLDDVPAPLIYINQVTTGSVNISGNSTGSTTCTLTAPSGFKIAHVLSIASNGNIIPAYVEENVSNLTGQTSKLIHVWYHNGTTYDVSCTFSVRYLCVRDGFLTTNGTTTL